MCIQKESLVAGCAVNLIKLALHFIRNHFIWIILLFLSQTVRNWYLFLSQGRQISNYDEYKDISWLHSKKHTFNLIWRQQSSNLLGFHTETSHFLKILSESGEAGPDRTMAYKWLHTAHLYYTKCLPSFMWQMLSNSQDSDSIWTNIKGPIKAALMLLSYIVNSSEVLKVSEDQWGYFFIMVQRQICCLRPGASLRLQQALSWWGHARPFTASLASPEPQLFWFCKSPHFRNHRGWESWSRTSNVGVTVHSRLYVL